MAFDFIRELTVDDLGEATIIAPITGYQLFLYAKMRELITARRRALGQEYRLAYIEIVYTLPRDYWEQRQQ